MEPALILRTSTVFLAFAAGGGLVIAGIGFATDLQPPGALPMLHGFLAGAAAALLLYAAVTVSLPKMAVWALAIFIVAAGGGGVDHCSLLAPTLSEFSTYRSEQWMILAPPAAPL